jgi:hypothetical protein
MFLYSLRDVLLDHYLHVFAAPDDKQVLSAIAQQVNSNDQGALTQTPSHFQVWRLGQVTDEGDVIPDKTLIAECSALVRRNLRPGDEPGADKAPNAPNGRQEPAHG